MASLQTLLYPSPTSPTSPGLPLPLKAASVEPVQSSNARDNLKAFRIHPGMDLVPAAKERLQVALKQDAWIHPNPNLNYVDLFKNLKVGTDELKIQHYKRAYFPPLRISALEFCQFIEKRLGVPPVLAGSAVGYSLAGRKNHDLDFKVFLQRQNYQDLRIHGGLDEWIIRLSVDFILEKLRVSGVPLNYEADGLRDLINSVYLHRKHQVINESERNCDAIFINMGHDFLFIMNPDYRWYLATFDRFLLSIDEEAIYYLSPQKMDDTEGFQKTLSADIQKTMNDLQKGQFIVEKPSETRDLFVRLIHASLKGMTIESPTLVIGEALRLLQSEYTMNSALFIKRIHTLFEKFAYSYSPVEILLATFSLLQHVKDPKLCSHWCWIAAQALRDDGPKIILNSIKSRKLGEYSNLLLFGKAKALEIVPREFNFLKIGGLLTKLNVDEQGVISDILTVIQAIVSLESERDPKFLRLQKIFFDRPAIEEMLVRCSTSLTNLKKYFEDLSLLLEYLGLPKKYMDGESNLLNALLRSLGRKSIDLGSLRPSFEELKKILGDHPGVIFPAHLKLKKDLQLCLDTMSLQERKTKDGLGEFIAVFAHRMKNSGFCPDIKYIRQMNERLAKLASRRETFGTVMPLTESFHLMTESILKKYHGIELLYEIKRFNQYTKKIGIITLSQAEAIDLQLMKAFQSIRVDHHLKLSHPFYQLWSQESFAKNPKFLSCLVGDILKETIHTGKETPLTDTDNPLYEIVNQVLESPYYQDHLDLIYAVYKELLNYALKKGFKGDLQKIGKLTIAILTKTKSLNLSSDEFLSLVKLVEQLLNLSSDAFQTQKRHFLGVKLVHLLAENCKIQSAQQNSLLLKSISVVLQDTNTAKTQEIYKKSIRLLLPAYAKQYDGKEIQTLQERLLGDLENRSSTMSRFIDFMASHNLLLAKEFLESFKPHMTSSDRHQAVSSICKKLISKKDPEQMHEAFLIWQKTVPDTASFAHHVVQGIDLFNAIQTLPQLTRSVLLKKYIQEIIKVLQQSRKDITTLPLAPHQQLTAHVEEILKAIRSTDSAELNPLFKEFWKVADDSNLIDRSRTPLPQELIQSALKEGKVPMETLAKLEKSDSKSMDSSELHAIKNLLAAPKPVLEKQIKIWEYSKKILAAESTAVSNDQKLGLVKSLLEKHYFFEVISYLLEVPAIGKFCHQNPIYWQSLVDALAQYEDLNSIKGLIKMAIHHEIAEIPLISCALPYTSQINLIKVLMILCKRCPENMSVYCNLFKSLQEQMPAVESKELRNRVKDFIEILLAMENPDALAEACQIFSKKAAYTHLVKTAVLLLNSFAPYEKNLKTDEKLNNSMLQLMRYLHRQNLIDPKTKHKDLQSLIAHVLGRIKKHPNEKADHQRQTENCEDSSSANGAATQSKFMLFDRKISPIKKSIMALNRSVDGMLRGTFAFTARLAHEIAIGAIMVNNPGQYMHWALLVSLNAAVTKFAYNLHNIFSKNHHITNSMISKVALKALCFTIFTGLTPFLIELTSRGLGFGQKFEKSYIDGVDVASLILPLAVFNESEYYDEDAISFITSLATAILTRKLAFKNLKPT